MKAIIQTFALLALGIFNFAQAEDAYKPGMTVVGIACRTSPETALEDIGGHWAKFFAEGIAQKIPNRVSNETIALYCDYEGDYTQPYTLVIGAVVSDDSDLPEGFVAKTIQPALYTKFTATGAFPESLIETWGKIWESNLPRAYSGDFEVYGAAFQGPDKQVDVWISIQE